MSAQVGEAFVELKLRGAREAQQKAKSALGGLGNIAKIASGVVGLQAGMSAVTGFLRDAGQASIGLSKGLGNVATLLGSQADTLLPKYQQGLMKISSDFGVAAESLSQPLYDLVSAGAPAEQAIRLLGESVRGGLVGIADAGQAVDVTTTAINAFGLAWENSGSVLDIVQAGIRRGKTTMGEIGSSLNQVAGLASKLGVSLESVIAANATMTKQGAPTAQAMTQLKAVFSSVLSNQERAAKMGPEVANAFSLQALESKGLQGFLVDLDTALKGDKEQMAKLLGSSEAVNAMLALTGDNAAGAAEDLDEVANSAGEVAKGWDKIKKTPAQQLAEAQQTLRNVGISLAQELLPPIATLLKDLTPLVELAGTFLKWVIDLDPTVKKFGITIGLTAVAIKTMVAAQQAENTATMFSAIRAIPAKIIALKASVVSMGAAKVATIALKGALTAGLAAASMWAAGKILELVKVIGEYNATIKEMDANRRNQTDVNKMLDQMSMLNDIINQTEDAKQAAKDLKKYYGIDIKKDDVDKARELFEEIDKLYKAERNRRIETENNKATQEETTENTEDQTDETNKLTKATEDLAAAEKVLRDGRIKHNDFKDENIKIPSEIKAERKARLSQLLDVDDDISPGDLDTQGMLDRMFAKDEEESLALADSLYPALDAVGQIGWGLEKIDVNLSDLGDNLSAGLGSAMFELSENLLQFDVTSRRVWKSFEKAALSALRQVGAEILSGAMKKGLSTLFGSIAGASAGPFGAIFGGIASLFADGGTVQGFRALGPVAFAADGMVVSRPRLAVVGEGGENEYIVPERKLQKLVEATLRKGSKASSGGNKTTIFNMTTLIPSSDRESSRIAKTWVDDADKTDEFFDK